MEKKEFKQILDERDEKFKGILTQALADTSRDLRDYVDSRLSASEVRITKQVTAQVTEQVTERFTKRMDEGFDGQRQLILDAVAESMDLSVHPRFHDHERRIMKLEAKIA